jgi:hypothetical protein
MMERSGEVMTSPTPNLASSAMGRAEVRDSAASAADAGPFVLNLCSSTTPMALAQTDLAELKRFTFFVSRRFEEGRERFRLHMGYFTTLAEAEEWLNVVREIYPGAWAGEAPGKKLRARAAAAAAAQAQHALGPQPRVGVPPPAAASAAPSAPPRAPVAPSASARASAPSPVQNTPSAPRALQPAPMRSAQASASSAPIAWAPDPKATAAGAPAPTSFQSPGLIVPTVHAAMPAKSPPIPPPPVVSPPVARAAPGVRMAPTTPIAAPRTSGGAQVRSALPNFPAKTAPAVATNAPPQAAGARAQAPVPSRLPAKGTAPQPAQASSSQRPGVGAKPASKGAFANSNVREVLAALDDTGETGQTRMMPAPVMPHADSPEDSTLTDTQVLKYLEVRRSDGDERSGGRQVEDSTDASISLLKPDDTGTRRALKDAVAQNAPVSFAVQLQWAVQPVELDKVPPLAIFSAYTLYTVEGSREGRKWYGLRLGFFSDAISAKQVAYYVRSEFASVAVVPVSPQEKTRATDEDRKSGAALAFPKRPRPEPLDEFKLIDSDDGGQSSQPASRPPQRSVTKPTPVAARSASPAPVATKRNPPPKGGGRVGARDRRGPQTLEETLEILGAGELEVDNGSGQTLNDTGVRHLRVEVQKNTPFSRLLERLSERTKKN